MSRLRSRLLYAAASVAIVMFSLGTARAEAAAPPAPAQPYYMALGDSLAFGYQSQTIFNSIVAGNYSPNLFGPGYVGNLLWDLDSKGAGLGLVNYGCPGETSGSFFGTCTFFSNAAILKTTPGKMLHDNYPLDAAGNPISQLGAALAFINAHPGQVKLITLDLGANDLINLRAACKAQTYVTQLQCENVYAPQTLLNVYNNVTFALKVLHAVAPTATIQLVQYYNPYEVDDPNSTQFALQLDNILAFAAASVGSKQVLTANPYPIFHGLICNLTNYCQPPVPALGLDIHPNAFGYAVMAVIMENSLRCAGWNA